MSNILTLNPKPVPADVEPAKILGMTIVVVVECACGSTQDLALVNDQPAQCLRCGMRISVDRVTWEKAGKPFIALSATPLRVGFQS